MKTTLSPGYIWLIIVGVITFCLLFNWLSGVLLPFIVAWVIAYMLNPMVNFLQHRCRFRFRALAVVATLLIAGTLLVGLFLLVIPPLLEECSLLKKVAEDYYQNRSQNSTIPAYVHQYFDDLSNHPELYTLLHEGDLIGTLKSIIPKMVQVIQSTTSAIFSFVASLIGILYLFFLMMDYEKYAINWTAWIPERFRQQARIIVGDFEHFFCGYFRGQVTIAMSNCIMFTMGFLITGFPMPVVLGCFIGIISFIPYLQVVGIFPAAILALLRAATSGESFWLLMLSVLVVYLVVQIIQDVFVTPRVMGKIMGLSPAIILLALSIGSFTLGITGLILALPLTTLAQLYYRRHILHDPTARSPLEKKQTPQTSPSEIN